MTNIIVAFSNRETAGTIRRLLVQSGKRVHATTHTGAQTLQAAGELDGGILICGYRFADMICLELLEYLGDRFVMVVITSPANCNLPETKNLIRLSTPLQSGVLLSAVSEVENDLLRRRKKEKRRPKERGEKEKEKIARAKELLMAKNLYTEEEAHRYMQKRSMENGVGMVETAEMVLRLFT